MPPEPSLQFKRILWYVFVGTRGGPTRIKIVEMLRKRPYNINQLKTELSMDYKSIQHNIKILEENKIIVPEEKKYGTMYFMSQLFEQAAEVFEEIKHKLGGK
jgi:predicted transcriptional regulator